MSARGLIALPIALAAALGAAPARAQTPIDEPVPAQEVPQAPPPPAPAEPPAEEEDLDAANLDLVEPDDGGDETVAQRLADLEQRLADTQDLLQRRRPLVTVGGYVDFGFFAVGGDGSGIVADVGPNRRFPTDAGNFSWVILGDLLAPAVNTRGEPADLANGKIPGVEERFDGIQSGGAPTFILNEVNVTLGAPLGESALVRTSLDFLPRSGRDFHLGDVFGVDIAELEWMPGARRRTSIFAGKMDSVIGIEYRERKSNQRFGITPSLLARYTTGTPLGVKVRTKLGADDWFVLAAAVTNGSSGIEQFHFYDEIDSNAGKTLSGRVSVAPNRRVEVGLSGEYGAQDHARDSAESLWFVGLDLQAHLGNLELKGQWLTGRGKGETLAMYDPAHRPAGLDLKNGAYLEADLMVTPMFGVLARGEVRDARIWQGAPGPATGERLYITKEWRAVVGVRAAFTERLTLKAEYLHNAEYGGLPQIRDDVLTTSLVLAF